MGAIQTWANYILKKNCLHTAYKKNKLFADGAHTHTPSPGPYPPSLLRNALCCIAASLAKENLGLSNV